MPPLHADHALAARIECSGVRDLVMFAETCARLDSSIHPAQLDVGGGVALFLAPDSPVNSIYGAGLAGPVPGSEIDAAERFYRKRGAHPAISMCPLADPSLVEQLGARGWLTADFENVLVRPLSDASLAAGFALGVTLHVARSPKDRGAWASISSRAFAAPDEPSEETLRLGRAMATRDDFVLLVGSVDGEDAGAGALWIDDCMGWLLGDATLPHLRRRGVQSALHVERVRLARDAGCDLAVTEARPGSTSQRNMERQGFRVVYTRVEMLAPIR